MNLLTKLTNNSCSDLPKVHLVKRRREDLDQPLEAAPPTKIQKIDQVPEETIILFETETEYNERIKDEEIEKLKLRVSQLENCEKLSQDMLLENQKLELEFSEKD